MSSLSQAASSVEKRTNARYWIVVMLFIVTSFNYGDRATLSIAGSEMAKDIGLDPVGMGYVFSAFSWAYVIGQIPGGWLLDRFGSKRVYFWSIFIWSMFTLLQGFVDIFSGFGIIVALFTLRFLVGLAEAPSFPGNSRIVAAWFPAQERGTAVSIFNSAQYFATVIFAPIMGWLTHEVVTRLFLYGRSGHCHQLYLVESHPRAKSTSGCKSERAGVHRRGWRADQYGSAKHQS